MSNLIIGFLIYLGVLVLVSLFLQGCTKNEKAFEERLKMERYEKE